MNADNVTELISQFANAAIKHHKASLEGDSEVANEQVDKINDIQGRLITLGSVGRDALLYLSNSEDDAVSLMAAAYSLKYNPSHCERVLKRLTKKSGLIGFSAKQALKRWQSGEWSID